VGQVLPARNGGTAGGLHICLTIHVLRARSAYEGHGLIEPVIDTLGRVDDLVLEQPACLLLVRYAGYFDASRGLGE